MIGRLRGILLERQAPHLLIDVGGVAYEVQASMQTFYQLPALGDEVTLHTHFVVREDAQQLYGFYYLDERAVFRALLKVSGIGPKLALTILSSVTPDEFIHCVNAGDSVSLVRLPGVGKKTAERLIIEMRDRLSDLPSKTEINTAVMKNTSNHSAQSDAINALITLGYKPQEASRALQGVSIENQSSEELIRLALKRMNT